MQTIVNLLQSNPLLIDIWRGVIWLCAVYLLLLGFVIFLRRDFALRFLGSFATTIGFNTLEVVLRFIAGLAFMGLSTELKYSAVAFGFGAVLCITALVMLALPMTHRHYGKWAIKFVTPIISFVGLSSIVLGGFLIYLMI